MSKCDKNSKTDEGTNKKDDSTNQTSNSRVFGMGYIDCLEGWVNRGKEKTD